MKKLFVAILFLSLTVQQGQANTWSRNNVIVEMMRSMLEMVTLWNGYQNSPQESYWNQGSYQTPALTIPPFPRQNTALIDGAWVSSQGAVLVVYRGLGRMYSSREYYEDYFISIKPDQLSIKNAKSGQIRHFQMQLSEGEMQLNNTTGQLIVFTKYGGFSESYSTQK